MSKKVFFIQETVKENGEYVVCIAEEGGSGFHKTDWLWGSDKKAAEELCEKRNLEAGIDKKEALMIVVGTMAKPIQKRPSETYYIKVAESDFNDADGIVGDMFRKVAISDSENNAFVFDDKKMYEETLYDFEVEGIKVVDAGPYEGVTPLSSDTAIDTMSKEERAAAVKKLSEPSSVQDLQQ